MSDHVTARQRFQSIWSKYSTVIILALIFILFSAMAPGSFLSGANFVRILEQSSITILLAVGEFFAILLAGIDLSVGSVMALTGVVGAQLMVLGLPWPVAVILGCVLLGALIGALNGWLINLTSLPPFVITLGTMAIFRGLTYVVSDARAVSGLPPEFTQAVGGRIFGFLGMPILIALVVSALLVFFTVKTKPGRNLYAMGGNPQAAWFAGINLKAHTLVAFTITGCCAGLAGMVNVARLGAAEPNAGTGYELFAIAAVIIGGTSFFGGEGKIIRVVIGGLIIGTINNGLNMVGVSAYYQQVAMGVLIVLAVTLDRFFGASSKR
ncbi:MAG: D-allose ABC transporter permease [Arachnia sp.]